MSGTIISISVSISFPYLLFWFLGAVNIACLGLLVTLSPAAIQRVSVERPSQQEMQPLSKSDGKEQSNGGSASANGDADEPEVELLRDADVGKEDEDK